MRKEELYLKLKCAFIDGLEELDRLAIDKGNPVYSYLGNHKNFPHIRDADKNVYPTFYLSDFGKVDFSNAFYKREFNRSFESWKDYKNYVINDEYLASYFQLGNFVPSDRKERANEFFEDYFCGGIFIMNMVDAYIHRFSKDIVGLNFDEVAFVELFELYYASISKNVLLINVLVPIIMVDFDLSVIDVSNNVSLVRISDSLQLSRNIRLSINHSAHPDVAGAATHAFMFSNIQVPNVRESEMHSLLSNLDFYADIIKKVESLFACLRVVTNVETGYCQIVAQPIGWQQNFEADLEQSFVASEKKYPSHFEKGVWWDRYSFISLKQSQQIIALYNDIVNSSGFYLAVQRLNKASLISPNDDAIIDIAIALESLLIGDESPGEITYKLKTRMVLLNMITPFNKISHQELREICGKIYNFRSSIVHGSAKKLDSMRYVEVNGEKQLTVLIAIQLLQHVIQVRIANRDIKTAVDIDKILYQLVIPVDNNDNVALHE